MKLIYATLLLAATPVFAQTPTPKVDPPATPPPAASQTENLAAQTLRQEIEVINGQIKTFEEEFARNHPGYQYIIQSGTVVPNTPPPAPAKPAEPAKTEPEKK